MTCLSYNNNEFPQHSNLILVIKSSKGNKTFSFDASVLSKMLADNLIIGQEKVFIGIHFEGN